jgi:acylphosphatase
MTSSSRPDQAQAAMHLLVSGRVQGVGFRYFVQQAADALGLAAWVRNRRDGQVEAVLVGKPDAVQHVLSQIGHGPRGASVDAVVTREALPEECRPVKRPCEIRPTV